MTSISNYPRYRIQPKEEMSSETPLSFELGLSERLELLECALHTAVRAGEIILDLYHSRTDINVELKSDNTPVTKADKASDERIIADLKRHTSFPIVTEERPLDLADRRDRKSVWIVDPLDGTQNFINRDGQFSVLIALLHFNTPVLGVIYAPVAGEHFYAVTDGGAFFQTSGGQPAKLVHTFADRPLQAVLSSAPSPAGRALEEQFCRDNDLKGEQVTRVGSAFKLGLLARGEFDLTIRFDRLGEWDVAAADCVLAEAGCTMRDILTNDAIAYNQRASLILPGYSVIRKDYQLQKVLCSD